MADGVADVEQSISVVALWNMLCGAVGGDEEGAELSEPLKVELAVFVKIVGQAIQV
jgi:bifunctional ADP-heptose synthase (sugar kinase/adenylyltransferase)